MDTEQESASTGIDTDGTGIGSDGNVHRLPGPARGRGRRGSAARAPGPAGHVRPGRAAAGCAASRRRRCGPAAPRAGGAAGATPGAATCRTAPVAAVARGPAARAGSAGGRRRGRRAGTGGAAGPARGRAGEAGLGAEQVRPRRAGATARRRGVQGQGARPDLLDHVDRLVDTLSHHAGGSGLRNVLEPIQLRWRPSLHRVQRLRGLLVRDLAAQQSHGTAGVRVGRVEGLIHQFGRLGTHAGGCQADPGCGRRVAVQQGVDLVGTPLRELQVVLRPVGVGGREEQLHPLTGALQPVQRVAGQRVAAEPDRHPQHQSEHDDDADQARGDTTPPDAAPGQSVVGVPGTRRPAVGLGVSGSLGDEAWRHRDELGTQLGPEPGIRVRGEAQLRELGDEFAHLRVVGIGRVVIAAKRSWHRDAMHMQTSACQRSSRGPIPVRPSRRRHTST